MINFFKSKMFLASIGFFAIIMALTNPGKLELINELRQVMLNLSGTTGESYTNLVICSFGTSTGYEHTYIRENGETKVGSQSTNVNYIGGINKWQLM